MQRVLASQGNGARRQESKTEVANKYKIMYSITGKERWMKPREVMKKLKEAGWAEVKGRNHTISALSLTGYRIPISNHPSKDIPLRALKNIELLTGVKLI